MRYDVAMTQSSQTDPRGRIRLTTIALAVLAFAIASGALFAAWVDNGPQILMALGSSALAWCF